MYALFIILIFFLMILLPEPVFEGASTGLLLWFNTVLPTLLPFLILSGLMIHTSALSFIARLFGPFLHRTLKVSPQGSFAVLAGFLCGFPMGAKVTADLLKSGKISHSEGGYLLSFCNNTSPMFIMSYILYQHIQKEEYTLPSIIILFASPILCSFGFRRFYFRRRSIHSSRLTENSSSKNTDSQRTEGFSFRLLDSCIMDGFEAIAKIGGYMILFSIFIALAKELPTSHPLIELVLLPSVEITTGISLICRSCRNFPLMWLLVLSLTSFGGLCTIAQTNSMLQGSGLSIRSYIIEKLITMMVTSLLALIYLCLTVF